LLAEVRAEVLEWLPAGLAAVWLAALTGALLWFRPAQVWTGLPRDVIAS